MQNYSLHKGTHLDIYKKTLFQDQEQVSEGSNTADSNKSRWKEMGRETSKEGEEKKVGASAQTPE